MNNNADTVLLYNEQKRRFINYAGNKLPVSYGSFQCKYIDAHSWDTTPAQNDDDDLASI